MSCNTYYAWIFVLEHQFLRAHSFPQASLVENCSLPRTDDVCGQISKHISWDKALDNHFIPCHSKYVAFIHKRCAARWERWVWYWWNALIDGKVRWNTDDGFPAFWLALIIYDMVQLSVCISEFLLSAGCKSYFKFWAIFWANTCLSCEEW